MSHAMGSISKDTMPRVSLGNTCIDCIYEWCVFNPFCVYTWLTLISSGSQMSTPSFFIGYVDGASRSTRHLASSTWALYNSDGELFTSSGIYLGQVTKNIAEYSSVVELLT